jgi:hypothetical protein
MGGNVKVQTPVLKRGDRIGCYPHLSVVIYCRCGRESSYSKLEALQTLNISTSVMLFLVMYSHVSMFSITKMLL